MLVGSRHASSTIWDLSCVFVGGNYRRQSLPFEAVTSLTAHIVEHYSSRSKTGNRCGRLFAATATLMNGHTSRSACRRGALTNGSRRSRRKTHPKIPRRYGQPALLYQRLRQVVYSRACPGSGKVPVSFGERKLGRRMGEVVLSELYAESWRKL
jgi:hypothetical protein